MAACGDRYYALIKTSLGTTPEAPFWGLGAALKSASFEDWYAWRNLAEQLTTRADAAVARLADVERERNRGFGEWNAAIKVQHELAVARARLGPFATTAPADGVPVALEVSKLAACVLETADDSLERLGKARTISGGDLSTSGADVGLGAWVLPALVVAAIGYGVYKSRGGDDDE